MEADDTSYYPQSPEHSVDDGLCKNCKTNPRTAGNHAFQLCQDCRLQLIRFPIPKWIWAFAGGVLLIMIAGLLRMPKYLSASIHLARGEKAMADHRYLTAEHELKKVAALFPARTDINGKLLIATAYNYDVTQYAQLVAKLEGQTIEDGELLEQMNTASQLIMQHFPQDTSLYARIEKVKNDPDSLEYIYFSLAGKDDAAVAGYIAADHMYEMKLYRRSDSLLALVLQQNPSLYAAQGLRIATKRSLGDYETSLALCDELLKINKENLPIISAKARTELKRKNDRQARKYAYEAMAIDAHNISSLEAMAMCEFFAGKKDESNELLAEIRRSEQESGDTSISERLSKILSGQEIYR